MNMPIPKNLPQQKITVNGRKAEKSKRVPKVMKSWRQVDGPKLDPRTYRMISLPLLSSALPVTDAELDAEIARLAGLRYSGGANKEDRDAFHALKAEQKRRQAG